MTEDELIDARNAMDPDWPFPGAKASPILAHYFTRKQILAIPGIRRFLRSRWILSRQASQ